MTPAEAEAHFVELWTAGVKTTEIAQRLGIPRGTAQSRAHRQQQHGLIAVLSQIFSESVVTPAEGGMKRLAHRMVQRM
jgi:hypothetical protein